MDWLSLQVTQYVHCKLYKVLFEVPRVSLDTAIDEGAIFPVHPHLLLDELLVQPLECGAGRSGRI